MSNTAEDWTAERVRALPDDGNRYELVSGQLVVTPAPRPAHQLALMRLYDRLRPYVHDEGIGDVLLSPADISLGEDELLQPDLFVFRSPANKPPVRWSEIGTLALVVEALSPATARYDRQLKRRRYQRAGVPEYWIVDLDARLIERWRPEDSRPEILAEQLVWSPDQDSEPLELDVAAYFREVWGSESGKAGSR